MLLPTFPFFLFDAYTISKASGRDNCWSYQQNELNIYKYIYFTFLNYPMF